MPSYLRELFAILLLCHVRRLFGNSHLLSEDILHEERRVLDNPEAHLSDADLKNCCLQKIESFLKTCGRRLSDFPTMSIPVYAEDYAGITNGLICYEMCYNKQALADEHQQLLLNLTDEQKADYGSRY